MQLLISRNEQSLQFRAAAHALRSLDAAAKPRRPSSTPLALCVSFLSLPPARYTEDTWMRLQCEYQAKGLTLTSFSFLKYSEFLSPVTLFGGLTAACVPPEALLGLPDANVAARGAFKKERPVFFGSDAAAAELVSLALLPLTATGAVEATAACELSGDDPFENRLILSSTVVDDDAPVGAD
jgi:hypothetical protein